MKLVMVTGYPLQVFLIDIVSVRKTGTVVVTKTIKKIGIYNSKGDTKDR